MENLSSVFRFAISTALPVGLLVTVAHARHSGWPSDAREYILSLSLGTWRGWRTLE